MTKNEEIRYKKIIWVLSVSIPIVVALLFLVRIPNVGPFNFLPPIYATINGITALLLIIAYWAVRNKKLVLHERFMKFSILLSAVFLVMYVAYHMTSEPTPFGGAGNIKYLYYFILVTHVLLSIFIIPMVLVTYVRAISMMFAQHKKIGKITFPIWLYIAVTGVIVYLMISPYYV